jgi:Na+-exporting ATPase
MPSTKKKKNVQDAPPPILYHTLEVKEVARRLKTDLEEGLTPNTAKHLLEEFGHNELAGQGGVSPWKVLLRQLMNALTAVLIIAAVSRW